MRRGRRRQVVRQQYYSFNFPNTPGAPREGVAVERDLRKKKPAAGLLLQNVERTKCLRRSLMVSLTCRGSYVRINLIMYLVQVMPRGIDRSPLGGNKLLPSCENL